MPSRSPSPAPLSFVPSRVFFSRGVGVHKIQRVAMQRAMQDAGVENLNLLKVSSVVAPRCEVITAQKGLRLLEPGSMVYAVIAQGETNEPHQRVTAALTWGQPDGDDLPDALFASGRRSRASSDPSNGMANIYTPSPWLSPFISR